MSQLELLPPTYLEPLSPVQHQPEATLEERFEAFHRANPHVYTELVKRALALRERGLRHFGIAAIFESLRYDAAIQTGGDEYKLNNSYRAFYARRIMNNVMSLKDFFEIREQKSVSDDNEE